MRRLLKYQIFTIVLLSAFAVSCGLGIDYGVAKIEAPNGEVFYFRREVRGLNYDALSLSKSNDYCAKPEPDQAIIFKGMGPHTVFFKFEGNELHIYVTIRPNIPSKFSENLIVVVHEISNPQFIQLKDTYIGKGLVKSDVPLSKSLFCF